MLAWDGPGAMTGREERKRTDIRKSVTPADRRRRRRGKDVRFRSGRAQRGEARVGSSLGREKLKKISPCFRPQVQHVVPGPPIER